ncbi:unnamed protein product [Oikopleura dioica]|uniref:28S ribosomal protein S15, mitochondrial n=1 Tax=Oikopleura dioica TaxID=34765 RepID=E4Z0G9_OIKDI|nr:unnamed protein product [Oikopleura dioica]
MLGSLSKRQLMSSISRTKRFQPWQYVYQAQIQHEDRERYAEDPNVRNTTPEHEKLIREGDADSLFLARLGQKRASKNSLWPKFDEEEGVWRYNAVPVLPNWKPLPGRITDNQERWAHESETICPWYREMLEKWLQENTFLTKDEKFQAKSVKKLCSVGYQKNTKKTLLKIMAMPLMQHEGDLFNDGVRIAALTIDIRFHQDELYYRRHMPSRGIFRHTVLLYKQRQYVLDRLRNQNFKLYCKTLNHLNIEHHSKPVYNMVYHKAITERVIDMKLRVMNHIEQEFMREHYLRERLADLQLKGEEIFKRDQVCFEETNSLMDRLLAVKEKINDLIPMIEQEYAKVEMLLDEGSSNRDEFLENYFQLKKSVMAMNESLQHPDINATPLDAILKDKEKSLLPQEIKVLIEESFQRATQILENCLDTAEYISTKV